MLEQPHQIASSGNNPRERQEIQHTIWSSTETEGQTDGWMGREASERVDGWKDGWIHTYIYVYNNVNL